MLTNLCHETRLQIQLEGISRCLRNYHVSVASDHCEQLISEAIPHSKDRNSTQLSSPDQYLTLSTDTGIWLKIAPLSPGGLFCDKLLLRSSYDSFSTLERVIRENGIEAKPACMMTSAEFHSRFRSDPQGHALQSDRAEYRLLIMMPDATESNRDDLLVDRICDLLDTLKPVPGLTSIDCVHKDTFGAFGSRELIARLKTRMPRFSRIGMTLMSPDRQSTLATMMSNASIALCGNSGNLADAFQFNLPVALWRDLDFLEADALNHDTVRWLRHGCRTSKPAIVRQQQKTWLHAKKGTDSTIVVCNSCSKLQSTIEKWLIHSNSHTDGKTTLQRHSAGRPSFERSTADLDSIIPCAFSPAASPNKLQLLRASFERKHKKLVKLRQSPSQFIADSEVRWLRAFKHPRQ